MQKKNDWYLFSYLNKSLIVAIITKKYNLGLDKGLSLESVLNLLYSDKPHSDLINFSIIKIYLIVNK
jgi:hypothetical protein